MLSLGTGTTEEFFSKEMKGLCLKDHRLEYRAKKILERLQNRLGSCIRRVFIDKKEARQAYDFF